MAQGVKGHQDMERMAKIREQKRVERLRQYHREILSGGGLPTDELDDELILPSTQHCHNV